MAVRNMRLLAAPELMEAASSRPVGHCLSDTVPSFKGAPVGSSLLRHYHIHRSLLMGVITQGERAIQERMRRSGTMRGILEFFPLYVYWEGYMRPPHVAAISFMGPLSEALSVGIQLLFSSHSLLFFPRSLLPSSVLFCSPDVAQFPFTQNPGDHNQLSIDCLVFLSVEVGVDLSKTSPHSSVHPVLN